MGIFDWFHGGKYEEGDSPLDRLLDPQVALPMAAGLMGSGSNMENASNALLYAGKGFGERKQSRKLNAQKMSALKFLRGKDDGTFYLEAVDAGLDPVDAMKAWHEDQKVKAQTAEYGLNPQYGVDADGNPVLIQIGNNATAVQTKLPEGVTLSKTPIKMDAGTHFVLLDPVTRQQVGIIPKDLAGAEAQKEIGTSQGKAAAAAPADYQAGQNALDLADSILTDPNRERGTGWSGLGNSIPATGGYDFQNKVDQAKSGAFLTAIQQMRGLGSLSNAEGGAATAAVTRMNTATSEEAFVQAVNDYKMIVQQGMERAKQSAQRGGVPLAADPSSDGWQDLGGGVRIRALP